LAQAYLGAAHSAALADVDQDLDLGGAQRAEELLQREAVDPDRRQPLDGRVCHDPAG
jgi:hypothetical protein